MRTQESSGNILSPLDAASFAIARCAAAADAVMEESRPRCRPKSGCGAGNSWVDGMCKTPAEMAALPSRGPERREGGPMGGPTARWRPCTRL